MGCGISTWTPRCRLEVVQLDVVEHGHSTNTSCEPVLQTKSLSSYLVIAKTRFTQNICLTWDSSALKIWCLFHCMVLNVTPVFLLFQIQFFFPRQTAIQPVPVMVICYKIFWFVIRWFCDCCTLPFYTYTTAHLLDHSVQLFKID